MLLDAGREFASGFPKLGGHLLKVLHFVSTAFRCAEYPQDDLKTVIHDSLMTSTRNRQRIASHARRLGDSE
jgi:hypothetical protein